MRQLVYRDLDKKNGKERIFTTTDEGKMLFPHRGCKVEFDNLTLLDDFKIVFEKENYGFFTGKKVEMALPSFKDIDKVVSHYNHDLTNVFMTDKYCLIVTFANYTEYNIIVTKDTNTGELIHIIEEEWCDLGDRMYRNSKYYAMYNMTLKNKAKEYNNADFSFILAVSNSSEVRDVDLARMYYVSRKEEGIDRCTFYDKCIITISPIVNHSKVYATFTGYNSSDIYYVFISHNVLLMALQNRWIKIVGARVYKDAVDKYFNLGFGNIFTIHNSADSEEERIFRNIVKSQDVKYVASYFCHLKHYYNQDYPIYLMNIHKYDELQSMLTKDEIEALHKATKKCIEKAESNGITDHKLLTTITI